MSMGLSRFHQPQEHIAARRHGSISRISIFSSNHAISFKFVLGYSVRYATIGTNTPLSVIIRLKPRPRTREYWHMFLKNFTPSIVMHPFRFLTPRLAGLAIALAACASFGQTPSTGKTFIDYFLPMPMTGALSSNIWGAATVGPRDSLNGLEDNTMKKWCYWDGQILKSPDGKYHLFASRWDQAHGHNGWFESKAVHAVSGKFTGPYNDEGLCWPNDQGGKGHNVTGLVLPDGRYAVAVSETRPGTVFVSKSPDGPWEQLGLIQVARNEFSKLGRMSNASLMLRPDGQFEIVPRSGAILISTNGVLGPYVVSGMKHINS
jgi:hypothetical protein